MIKRVVTIISGFESLGYAINDYISNELKENEYIIDIKYIKDVNRIKSYEKNRGIAYEAGVIAIVHIGG